MNAARTRLPQSLFPRSLRARLILLVLGAVLLAQAATLTTVSYFLHKFMKDIAIGYIVTTIPTLRAAVSQVPAEDRADFVRNASQNQWRLWARTLPANTKLQRFNGPRHTSRNRPKPAPEPGPDESARPRHRSHAEADDMLSNFRVFVRQLNERLNDGTRVALSNGPTPEIFISLAPNSDIEDMPGLREWLIIPLERLDPPVATPLIAAWLERLGRHFALCRGVFLAHHPAY